MHGATKTFYGTAIWSFCAMPSRTVGLTARRDMVIGSCTARGDGEAETLNYLRNEP